jgi:hypothetical protein
MGMTTLAIRQPTGPQQRFGRPHNRLLGMWMR